MQQLLYLLNINDIKCPCTNLTQLFSRKADYDGQQGANTAKITAQPNVAVSKQLQKTINLYSVCNSVWNNNKHFVHFLFPTSLITAFHSMSQQTAHIWNKQEFVVRRRQTERGS